MIYRGSDREKGMGSFVGCQQAVCVLCGESEIPVGVLSCPSCGSDLASQRNLLPVGYGLGNGQYEIKRVLGQGGFGITYAAVDKNLHREVAIKEFFPQHCVYRDNRTYSVVVPVSDRESYERSLARFEQEGRILAQLNHRNIVKVYSLFRELGTAYLVMELLDGHSLGDELELRGNVFIPGRLVQKIGSALVDALSLTHQANIFHLDIKPDNIMLTTDGRIVLLDFGAARWQPPEGGNHPKSVAAYTPEYAPLELVRGDAIGPETDIFELGVLFYELLTGKRPPDVLERLQEQKNWEPDVEMPWFQLITEALRLERQDRPRCVRQWWHQAFSSQITNATRPAERQLWVEPIMRLYGRFSRSNSPYKYILLISIGLGTAVLLSMIIWTIFAENSLGMRRYWAEEAVTSGKLSEALKHYNRALQMSPQDGSLYESRGDVRNRLKDFNGAILDYREALRLQSGSPTELQSKLAKAYINLGDYQQSLGNFTEAIASYQQAGLTSTAVKNIADLRVNEAQLGDANAKLKANQFVDAVRLHEEILANSDLSVSFREQVTNSLVNVLFLYGESLREQGEHKKALQLYDLAIGQSKKDKPSLYVARGTLLAQTGNYTGALADLDQAIRLDDGVSSYYGVRGQVKAKIDNQLGAIADFNQAIKLGDNSALIHLSRGLAYMKIQNYKSAIDDFNKALTIEEANELARLNRGWALYALRDYSQAITDFSEVIQMNPENASAYEGSGYVKFFLRDVQGSKYDLDKAIELYRKTNETGKVQEIMNWRQQHNL